MRVQGAAAAVPIGIAIAGAASLLASGSIALAPRASTFPGASTVDATLSLAVGATAIVVGLEAFRRREPGRWPLLLASAGITWLAVDWSDPVSGNDVLFTAGLLLRAVFVAVVAHLAVAYRERATSRIEAGVALAGYAVLLLVLGLLPTLMNDVTASGCSACPANLLLAESDPAAAQGIVRLGSVLAACWAIALLVVAARLLLRARPAARRVEGPILIAAVVVAMAFAAESIDDVASGMFVTDQLGLWLWRAQAVGLAAIAVAVVAGWVEARRTRGRVVKLLLEMAEAVRPGTLQLRLGRLVKDPDLALAYAAGPGRWIDASGRAVVPEERLGRRLSSIMQNGEIVAVLDHRVGIEEDRAQLAAIVGAARLGLERERLAAGAAATLEELRASRARLVAADDRERRGLERDLHDGAQQRLVALALALRSGGGRGAGADAARAEVDEAIAELRDVAHGLYPAVLMDEGLGSAIEALAESSRVPLRIGQPPVARFPPTVEATAYLIIADAVAAATTVVDVALSACADHVAVTVGGLTSPPPSLVELQDRAAAIGGTLTLEPDGDHGVIIRAELPCGS